MRPEYLCFDKFETILNQLWKLLSMLSKFVIIINTFERLLGLHFSEFRLLPQSIVKLEECDNFQGPK